MNNGDRIRLKDLKADAKEKYKHKYEREEVIIPFEEKQYQDVFSRLTEKEMIKTVKEESDDDRKEIEKEATMQEEFMQAYLSDLGGETKYQAPKENSEMAETFQFQVPQTSGMVELPNIFNT